MVMNTGNEWTFKQIPAPLIQGNNWDPNLNALSMEAQEARILRTTPGYLVQIPSHIGWREGKQVCFKPVKVWGRIHGLMPQGADLNDTPIYDSGDLDWSALVSRYEGLVRALSRFPDPVPQLKIVYEHDYFDAHIHHLSPDFDFMRQVLDENVVYAHVVIHRKATVQYVRAKSQGDLDEYRLEEKRIPAAHYLVAVQDMFTPNPSAGVSGKPEYDFLIGKGVQGVAIAASTGLHDTWLPGPSFNRYVHS